MYDLCKIIESIKSHEDHKQLFPRASKATKGLTTLRGKYNFDNQVFSITSSLGKGASGRVMKGFFGIRPVVVKRNVNVPFQEDVNESIMQTRLYCFLKQEGVSKNIAQIPEAIFTASIPGFGRVLGMEGVDTSMLEYVKSLKSSDQIPWLRSAIARVCRLLILLQKRFSFMHGDMHSENIMIRGDDVFLIDFGMASAKFDKHPRLITNTRYEKVRFHSQLDLMTLLTSLREDLGIVHHDKAAAWCGSFVNPYWDVVRKGVLETPNSKLPYGARRTVRTAIDEINTNGEVYYAHHLLYEDIGRVSYPPCEPQNLLSLLYSSKAPTTLRQERLFEDI